jgi:hypothetical protein
MRDDQERLLDILEAIEKIEKYANQGRHAFETDELIQSWILNYLRILGRSRPHSVKPNPTAIPLDPLVKDHRHAAYSHSSLFRYRRRYRLAGCRRISARIKKTNQINGN